MVVETPKLSDAEIRQLREAHYNATAVRIDHVHEDLMILRVRPDGERPDFCPGQYTVLGLGYWEPRLPDTQPEDVPEAQWKKLIKRAYSFSCSLVDEHGRLRRAQDDPDLEFYIVLVRQSEHRPPALTPRLFALKEGDRLFMSPHARGRCPLEYVSPEDNLYFMATGTGEAPHNAMIAEALYREHRGRIVCVTSVRYRRDLAYLEKHRRLEAMFANYQYVPITTREPENLDATHPHYVGKRHLQDLVESGDLERQTGVPLDPETTHVFLCGNPEMIGVPHHTHDPRKRYPLPRGMVEILEKRGFRIDEPHEPGNVHFERYW